MNVIRVSSYVSLADDMNAAIEAFMTYTKAKNLSPRTIEYYSERMLSFQTFLAEKAPATTLREVILALTRE